MINTKSMCIGVFYKYMSLRKRKAFHVFGCVSVTINF